MNKTKYLAGLCAVILGIALSIFFFSSCDIAALDSANGGGITSSRGYFYLLDRATISLVQLDAQLHELKRWPLYPITGDSSAQGITFDGSKLWISAAGNVDRIFKIDASGDNLVVLDTIAAPPTKHGTIRDLAWDGTNLWVLNSGSTTYFEPATLYKLNPLTHGTIATYTIPSPEPRGLTFVHSWTTAYGTTYDPALFYTDVTKNMIYQFRIDRPVFDTAFTSPAPPRGITYVYPVGITFDGMNFWIVNSSGTSDHVFRVDSKGKVQERYELPYAQPGPIVWASFDARTPEPISVSSVSPPSGIPGSAFSAEVYGTGFIPGSGLSVDFGAGISVDTPLFVNNSYLKVNISIGTTAAIGKRNVKVTNPDGQFAVGDSLFEVTSVLQIPYLWLADQASGQYAVHKIRVTDTTLVRSWSTTAILSASGPQGLAFDGTDLWMSTSGTDRKIYKIDTTDAALASLSSIPAPAVGGTVRGITFDASGNLWVSVSAVTAGGGRIFKMNVASGAILDTIATPGQNPRGITFANNILYCNDTDLDSIYSYDGSNWSSKFQTPTTGGAGRFATGLTWDGTSFWIANSTTASDYLFKVSATGTVLQIFHPSVSGDPQYTGLVYVAK